MNWRSAIFVPAVLLLRVASAHAEPSEGSRALQWSVGVAGGDALVGTALMLGSLKHDPGSYPDQSPLLWSGALVTGLGLVVGPSVGRIRYGDKLRGGLRIALRLAVAGAGSAIVYAGAGTSYEGGSNSAQTLAIVAPVFGGFILGHAIYDIATTRRDVSALRQSALGTVSIAPMVVWSGARLVPCIGLAPTF